MPAALFLLALDLFLAERTLDLSIRRVTVSNFTRSSIAVNISKRLALVFGTVILLGVAAQMNTLAQVIHRPEVIAPVRIESAAT